MATDLELCTWCVVPAAGRSRRFGGVMPKQYAQIAGQPMLWHTLERLAGHPRILGLLVVLAPGDHAWPELERIGKYNQLLRIEEALADKARYAGCSAFRQLSGH